MRNLAADLRFALSVLTKRPGFSLVAIVTLALGIGANAAIFSAVRGVLLRPLPFHAPDQLVALNEEQYVSNAELLYLREHATSFSEIGSISPGWSMALTGAGEAAQITTSRISPNLLDVLGTKALIGRNFATDESTPGRQTVALLGYGLWQERFGGDGSVLDRRIVLDGTPYTVVGVLPPDFEVLGRPADVMVPMVLDQTAWFHKGAVSWMIARLDPGTPIERARSEIAALLPTMRAALEYDANHYDGVRLLGLHERVVGNLRTSLLVLLGAVGLMVLIAGANVGNLLLIRAAGRRREIAVRRALGATRGRIITQMLLESVLLALAGALAGLVLGMVGAAAIRAGLPPETPRMGQIGLDGTVFAFCAGLSVLIGLGFGLAPAILASRGSVQPALGGTRGTAGRMGGERARGSLIVAEVALTLVLIIGAGLMMRTLWSLNQVDPGFRASGSLTFALQPSGERYRSNERRVTYLEAVVDQMASLPGVRSAGMIHHLPLGGYSWYSNIELEGRPLAPDEQPMRAGWRVISGDYLRAMGVSLLQGRAFTESDVPGSAPVAIVNETFAREAWPGQDPIGKRFRAEFARDGAVTVVGIVGDVRHETLAEAPVPEVYRPMAQTPMSAVSVVLRTDGDPASLVPAVRRRIQEIDADVPISNVQTMEDVIAASVATPRLIMTLLTIFAGLALLLGTVGMYGVIAYAVAERRREIGVRIALGATPARVTTSVLARGVRYAVIGVVIGVVGGLLATRIMSSLVFGVSTKDPLTFMGLSLFLVAVAALASYLPARQAAGTDPMVTLRLE